MTRLNICWVARLITVYYIGYWGLGLIEVFTSLHPGRALSIIQFTTTQPSFACLKKVHLHMHGQGDLWFIYLGLFFCIAPCSLRFGLTTLASPDSQCRQGAGLCFHHPSCIHSLGTASNKISGVVVKLTFWFPSLGNYDPYCVLSNVWIRLFYIFWPVF